MSCCCCGRLGFVPLSLLINYFGQGALLLAYSAAIENPFCRTVPEGGLVPLTRQAVQHGLLPR